MRISVSTENREEALRAGFAALLERLPHGMSFELFKHALDDWDVSAFHDGTRAVGMLMVRGAELHVAVLPEVRGRWLSRRLIREVFAPILAQHGEARTSVEPDNARGLEFVRRIRDGFATLRFDPVTALTSIGGSLLTGALQGKASKEAASQAASAQNNATNAQLQMFNTQNEQQAPYRQAGSNALNLVNYGFGTGAAPARPFNLGGIQYQRGGTTGWQANLNGQWTDLNPATTDFGALEQTSAQGAAADSAQADKGVGYNGGYFTHQFDVNDLNANLAPNWAFSLAQGIGAQKNAGNLQTGLLSGNTLKGIADYTLAKSGDLFQQAYNNYTANQSNIFNRLSTIAGLGSAANQQSAGLAGSIAPSVANTITGAGAAQAAGTVGAANALASGGSNALGWYQLNNLMQNYNSGSTTVGNAGGQTQIGDYGAS